MKIKATVVTGFLGAGKTTFINNIVKNNRGIHFALVENEFGEASIDTQLIGGIDAGKMFELKDGCICCTITNEYELILLELAEKFPNTEHLIIETTGIADPVPVIKPFLSDREVGERYEYKGTITIVDAINYSYKPSFEITEKQIAVADKIYISKTQGISELAIKKLKHKIESINPFIKPQFMPHDYQGILTNTWLKDNKLILHDSPTHLLHYPLEAITVKYEEPFEKETFLEALTYKLDIYKQKIFRVKGIINFKEDPFRYILQGVGGNFEIYENGINIRNQTSELVFFGELNGLDFSFLNIN